ncbi:MAG: chemotaxis protein CheW [Leptospirales bacterium]
MKNIWVSSRPGIDRTGLLEEQAMDWLDREMVPGDPLHSEPAGGVDDFGAEVFQMVSFCLSGEYYAVDVMAVQEINRLSDVTRVPRAPHYVDGVINLRGKILPVINLRKLLGFPPMTEVTEEMRMIVVNTEGMMAGLTVDEVNQVIRIPTERVETDQDFVIANKLGDLIRGVAHLEDRLVTLLDIGKLVAVSPAIRDRQGV